MPPFFTSVLENGANSSPLLAGMESPLSVSYPPDSAMASGCRYILPLNTSPYAICVVHPTPPHYKGGPPTTSVDNVPRKMDFGALNPKPPHFRTEHIWTSGERDSSSPWIELSNKPSPSSFRSLTAI